MRYSGIKTKMAAIVWIIHLVGCGSTKSEDSKPQFAPSKTRSIYVTGDEGVSFKGSLGSDGSTSSVSGVTPKEFTLDDGTTIAAAIQKNANDGTTLRVECYFYGGSPKKTAETKEGYGVASVACSGSN